MPSTTELIEQRFQTRWDALTLPDGGMLADAMTTTRNDLIQEFADLLTGQPDTALAAIQRFSVSKTHVVSYELAQLMVQVLALIDESGDDLQRLVEQENNSGRFQWYLRRAAIQALGSRGRQDLVPLFRRVLLDDHTEVEVRAAALSALVHLDDTASVPMIEGIDPSSWYISKGLLLEARGLLGDVTATWPLIEAAYNPWHHHSSMARNGLAHLEHRLGGLGPMLDQLPPLTAGSVPERLQTLARTSSSPQVRRWCLDGLIRLQGPGANDFLLQQLDDPDWLVLQGASDALSGRIDPPLQALQARVVDQDARTGARLWAAYTLLKLGEQPEALATIPDLRVELPGVPQEVREAVLRYWTPYAELGTDVRWLIEGRMLPAWTEDDEAAIRSKFPAVLAAFVEIGLPVDTLIEAGEYHQQGDGTYVVVRIGSVEVALSTLGRFAGQHGWGGDDTLPAETLAHVRLALAGVGWTWLDGEVLSVKVEGLNVYSFGSREALIVQDLLFYWQD